MVIAENKRILLRVFNENDLNDAMQFWGNKEVMKYCYGSTCIREDVKVALKRFTDSEKENGYSVYGIVEKYSSRLIGACGFKETYNLEIVEMIYHLAEGYWGKGYASEAGKLAIEYLKKGKVIKKIEASVFPENRKSIKVLLKLGFTYSKLVWVDDSKCNEPLYEYIL